MALRRFQPAILSPSLARRKQLETQVEMPLAAAHRIIHAYKDRKIEHNLDQKVFYPL
jgi:hypothetical protein